MNVMREEFRMAGADEELIAAVNADDAARVSALLADDPADLVVGGRAERGPVFRRRQDTAAGDLHILTPGDERKRRGGAKDAGTNLTPIA